ncbi:MAG: flavin reductase (DIM6/NTAB) family NADH-FMN oxidoreductase RutF [Cyclobacteriaceae bacterium]|jgi:flavin reductase (DIM6/NTAB) family NADH-FMN oxidoreductase RutF
MNQEFNSIDPSSLSTKDLHQHLLACVAPRPIALASTIDHKGNVNLSPFSFFNVFSANPPILIFSPARRGKGNTNKHTYENVKEIGEVVINIVNYPIAQKMYQTSLEYNKGINEFEKSGLTELASDIVKPPRVLEAPASFECTVDQVIELGDQGGAGNLVICRVVRMHIKKEYFGENGLPDSTKLNLIARMGGDWYSRAYGESLFKIADLDETQGVGIESLSRSIRNSNILTEHELLRLGSVHGLPTQEEIERAKSKDEVRELFLEFEIQRDMIKDGLHRMGKSLIHEGQVGEALATLLIVDQI